GGSRARGRSFAAGLAPCRLVPCIAGSRWQFHASATRLGQPDGYGLLRGTCAMLALADVMDLFPHEFSGLRRRRLALPRVATRTLKGFFFRHRGSLPSLLLSAPWRSLRSDRRLSVGSRRPEV